MNVGQTVCPTSTEVCLDGLKLSTIEIIVSLKSFNVEGKLKLFGQDYYFTSTLCANAKLNLWVRLSYKRMPQFF